MEEKKGFLYALFAFITWGFFAIYFKLFDKNVSVYEILAHRIIWSVVFLSLFLFYKDKFKSIKNMPKNLLPKLFITGILIGVNWGVYIYAIADNQILQASLGYFITPLISVLLGFLILKENLNLTTKIGVGIICIAIILQIFKLGSLPLICIIMPLSFGLYGLLRKKMQVNSANGLLVETAILLPIVLSYEFYLAYNHKSSFGFDKNGLLMILSGPLTVLPLIAFTKATKLLSLSTIGLMQYIAPSISFLVAVFLYNEKLDFYNILSFSLIWFALFLTSFSKIKGKK